MDDARQLKINSAATDVATMAAVDRHACPGEEQPFAALEAWTA